jgi:hypothetical protein
MAKRIRRIMPWFLILALICLTTIGVNFLKIQEAKGAAATSSASGTVNNAAPSVSAVNLTSATYDLTENGTTTITVTATITDTNGGTEISSATATIYLVSEGTGCDDDDNNCYTNVACQLGSAVGNDKNATCTASDIYFHATPGSWGANVLAEDSSASTGSATDTTPSTINTLHALIVTGSVTYDALNPGANMDNLTKTVYATTTGNAAIDVQIKGDDMSDNGNSIGVENQRYSTTTDCAWASGVSASSTYQNYEVDLAKPTTHPSDSEDIIYWGWTVPTGQPAGTYTGTVYFNPVSD